MNSKKLIIKQEDKVCIISENEIMFCETFDG